MSQVLSVSRLDVPRLGVLVLGVLRLDVLVLDVLELRTQDQFLWGNYKKYTKNRFKGLCDSNDQEQKCGRGSHDPLSRYFVYFYRYPRKLHFILTAFHSQIHR